MFLDVDDLRSGPFNTALFRRIDSASDILVILTPTCLERCRTEGDWMRQEPTIVNTCLQRPVQPSFIAMTGRK
jgi:hypothetical protein